MYLSGLLNSKSMNFVTRSIKMISGGSKIAAYIFCECHRKFHRVLCKCPKRERRLWLPLWGLGGGGHRQVGLPPHLLLMPLCDTVGTQSAYSLVEAVTLG